jgi:hypothetical protein
MKQNNTNPVTQKQPMKNHTKTVKIIPEKPGILYDRFS